MGYRYGQHRYGQGRYSSWPDWWNSTACKAPLYTALSCEGAAWTTEECAPPLWTAADQQAGVTAPSPFRATRQWRQMRG